MSQRVASIPAALFAVPGVLFLLASYGDAHKRPAQVQCVRSITVGRPGAAEAAHPVFLAGVPRSWRGRSCSRGASEFVVADRKGVAVSGVRCATTHTSGGWPLWQGAFERGLFCRLPQAVPSDCEGDSSPLAEGSPLSVTNSSQRNGNCESIPAS